MGNAICHLNFSVLNEICVDTVCLITKPYFDSQRMYRC